jgi:hypothetical protein
MVRSMAPIAALGLAVAALSPEAWSVLVGLEVAAGRLLDRDPVGAAEALLAVAA